MYLSREFTGQNHWSFSQNSTALADGRCPMRKFQKKLQVSTPADWWAENHDYQVGITITTFGD